MEIKETGMPAKAVGIGLAQFLHVGHTYIHTDSRSTISGKLIEITQQQLIHVRHYRRLTPHHVDLCATSARLRFPSL